MQITHPLRFAILSGALLFAAATSASAQTGEANYKSKCQMCHGATGAADTPTGKTMKIKSFADPEVVKQTDDALINVTKNGQGKMPAYKDKMSDADIKGVIAHIRELQKKK